MSSKKIDASSEIKELLRTMMIVHLGLANIPQRGIRSITGCDIKRVNQTLKHLKRKGKAKE